MPSQPCTLTAYNRAATDYERLPSICAVPSERYEVDPELAKALEIIFILHLDHEQNASTSTVRTAGQCGLCGAAWLGLAWLGQQRGVAAVEACC